MWKDRIYKLYKDLDTLYFAFVTTDANGRSVLIPTGEFYAGSERTEGLDPKNLQLVIARRRFPYIMRPEIEKVIPNDQRRPDGAPLL